MAITLVNARDARNGWGMNGITTDANGATALATLNCRWRREDIYNIGSGGSSLDSLVAPYGTTITNMQNAMNNNGMYDPSQRLMIIFEDYQQGWPNCVRSSQMPAIFNTVLAMTAPNGDKAVRIVEGPNEMGGGLGGGSIWPDGTPASVTGNDIAPNGAGNAYQASSGQSDAHDPYNRKIFGYWAKFLSDTRASNTTLWNGVILASPTILDVGNGGNNQVRAPSNLPLDYPSAAYPNGDGLGVSAYVDYATFHYYLNAPNQTAPAGDSSVNDVVLSDGNQLNFDTYLIGSRHGISGGGSTMPTIVTEVGQAMNNYAQDYVGAAWSDMATFLVFFANGGKVMFWYNAPNDSRNFGWFSSYPTGVRAMGKCMANISSLLSLGNAYNNNTVKGVLAGPNVTNASEFVKNPPAFTPAYDGTVKPGQTGFSITLNSGTPHWGNSGNYLIFPKSDGSTMIAVWREPRFDDGNTAGNSNARLTASGSINITCNFGSSQIYNIWDPTGATGGNTTTIGTSPTKLSGPTTGISATFNLYCSPIFIELTAAPAATVRPNAPTLTNGTTASTDETVNIAYSISATNAPSDVIFTVLEIT